MTLGKIATLYNEYKKDHGFNEIEEKPKERAIAF